MSDTATPSGCVLCTVIAPGPAADEDNLVLSRGRLNFVIINKYPYSNGHLMVAPNAHVGDLAASSDDQLEEMMLLARACETILGETYRPEGFNMGLNIGQAAGAGVTEHLHLHVVPRWPGDANFMTAIADTRVVPETPDRTYARLRPLFDQYLDTREAEHVG